MIHGIGIVVPASNEEEDIGSCLDALARARTHLLRTGSRRVDVRVVVALDSCVDGTKALVDGHGVESVVCTAGQVGTARAIGTEHLLNETALSGSQLWLAHTDADSTVPHDWLTRMLGEAESGAHLVLGTVLPLPGLASYTERAWFGRHRLRADHPHVHGANLGIRADAYVAAGGWPRLATGEDVALAENAASVERLKIARKADMPVSTSVRMQGRAPGGFSSYLRGIDLSRSRNGPCD